MTSPHYEMELPKNYDPKAAEQKWQQFWADNDLYEYHPNPIKETFTIDTPPPTVSGKMHLGHAFSYTQQDIIARYQRMRGKNVFFPFGTDDNGLPTEKLVEKKKNILSTKMSREQFVTICNSVIEEEKPLFIQSWKDIGMSADFKRSYSTINKHCQITSQASFIDLYKKGQVYRQESPVSWCVLCQTAIAQAEFESVDMTSHFNQIAFKVGGKELIIATTRPELLPACVALFYNPHDPRYQHLKGKFVTVPIFNHDVPILEDDSVDLEKGTGLMMVCTFGDKEDVDKWHRFKLPLRVVFEKDGRMNTLAKELAGMKIKEARQKCLELLKNSGHLIHQKEISHAVNVHERCKTEIEFLKTSQWYIKILDRKQELLDAANEIIWYPPHMKVRYDHWVQNLNWDWCISRQRHFGIPIPVWTCLKCNQYYLPNITELPIDPTTRKPSKPCPCGSTEFKGETDVLDTWATSSVSPEITTNWIHQGEYQFQHQATPLSLRPQAHDIIRTWLFYTIVKSVYHHNRIPWKNVMISGHAQDPHGRKMSKSLGNIIEPQEMIKRYSADALRFWAAGSTLGDDLPFQEKDLVTGQKFATKLWNATKFSLMHLQDYTPSTVTETFDLWMLSKLHDTIQECTQSFEQYEYSKAKSTIDHFFWHIFCDYYLEIVKDRLYKPEIHGNAQRQSAQQVLHESLRAILKLTAPIMPHITEEIYHLFLAERENEKSIHLSAWPTSSLKKKHEHAELCGDLGIDIISTVRKYKAEQQLSLKDEIKTLTLVSSEKDFTGMIASIEADLKAVLNAKTIVFNGKTTLETEVYKVSIGTHV